MAYREEIAADFACPAENQVQQDGCDHHEEDEPHDVQRGTVNLRQVEHGSHYHTENEDEKHAQFESLGQFSDFLAERSNDGQRGDGEDDHQLIDFAHNQDWEPDAYAEHGDGEQQSEHHLAESFQFQHAVVVLEGTLHYSILVHILLHGGLILERQELAEQLVAAGQNEDDER